MTYLALTQVRKAKRPRKGRRWTSWSRFLPTRSSAPQCKMRAALHTNAKRTWCRAEGSHRNAIRVHGSDDTGQWMLPSDLKFEKGPFQQCAFSAKLCLDNRYSARCNRIGRNAVKKSLKGLLFCRNSTQSGPWWRGTRVARRLGVHGGVAPSFRSHCNLSMHKIVNDTLYVHHFKTWFSPLSCLACLRHSSNYTSSGQFTHRIRAFSLHLKKIFLTRAW